MTVLPSSSSQLYLLPPTNPNPNFFYTQNRTQTNPNSRNRTQTNPNSRIKPKKNSNLAIPNCQNPIPILEILPWNAFIIAVDYIQQILTLNQNQKHPNQNQYHIHIHRHGLHQLVVGLDVEWRPNTISSVVNPTATLQLCVSRRCLVFQIIHAPSIPQSLVNFLENYNYTIIGVDIGISIGIESDVEKLSEDYGMDAKNAVELRSFAVR